MSNFNLVAGLVVLTAAFAYLNYRLLKFPLSTGLMLLALLFSAFVVVLGRFFPAVEQKAVDFVHQVDLSKALLQGMLGFLLFAGALHINLNDLIGRGWPIGLLATVGVLLSTVLVGCLTWVVLWVLSLEVRFISCLLFGALISPTDPIAVLALLKKARAPRDMEVIIAGESLLNDGIGVVVFLGLLQIAVGEHRFSPGPLATLFLREVVGGAVFGLAVGLLVYWLLKSVDNYQVEILLSLALVAGGYALAVALHLSGPIAMVAAGLLIGNHGRNFAMSRATVEHLDLFWELIDEILNAVLFVLLGLEVLVLSFTAWGLLAGLLVVPVVLFARWLSVGLPIWSLRRNQAFPRNTVKVLTWGGLRGAISVALALSLPNLAGAAGSERDEILVLTYVVVVFSLLVQALTFGPLMRRWVHP
jgi:CPA1 family monovalent cation:H+ antiporter